jgi:hypothetical protein
MGDRNLTAAICGGLALLTLGLSGCGSTDGVVQGKVTSEGAAVASAQVMFASKDDPSQEYFGVTGDDGSLHLTYRTRDGLPPGRYAIRITRATLKDGSPVPPGEEGTVLRQAGEVVSRRYEFERDVTAGMNQFDLKLEEGVEQ